MYFIDYAKPECIAYSILVDVISGSEFGKKSACNVPIPSDLN